MSKVSREAARKHRRRGFANGADVNCTTVHASVRKENGYQREEKESYL